MPSKHLVKCKITGREHDIKAINRIKSKIETEKTALSALDASNANPSYHDMTSEDLERYKQDLLCRLMYFQTESNDIKTEIKKIQKVQDG